MKVVFPMRFVIQDEPSLRFPNVVSPIWLIDEPSLPSSNAEFWTWFDDHEEPSLPSWKVISPICCLVYVFPSLSLPKIMLPIFVSLEYSAAWTRAGFA